MIRKSLLIAAISFAIVTPLAAAPITQLDGVIGQWTLTNNFDGTATLMMTPGNSGISTINSTAIPGGLFDYIPTSFAPANITINTVDTSINFDLTKVVGPGGTDENGVPVTGSVSFDANLNLVDIPTDFTMIIQGNEQLMSDTSPELDMSLWDLGSLIMTFNVANTQASIQSVLDGTNATTTGSGSFSQSNVPFGVPEPASIAIWTLLGFITCVAASRLKRRKS